MSNDAVAGLGTILGIWAHPDDEAYLSAGVMATAVAQHQRVVCVTATAGEAGFAADDPRPAAARVALRAAEMEACLAELGVTEHHWLGYPDGGCGEVEDAAAVSALTPIFDAVCPDTVLTFGPDGMTAHVDHIAASRWATLAARELGARTGRTPMLLYATRTEEWLARFDGSPGIDATMMDESARVPTVHPDALALHLELTPALLERKIRALGAQASQVEPLRAEIGDDLFRVLNRDEFFRGVHAHDWA